MMAGVHGEVDQLPGGRRDDHLADSHGHLHKYERIERRPPREGTFEEALACLDENEKEKNSYHPVEQPWPMIETN